MTRVLVTGVAGFTGRYVVPLLIGQGHEVHGLGHDPGSADVAGVAAMHRCDIADQRQLLGIIDRVQPDKVIHLAGIAYIGHDNVDAIYRTNLIGSRNLLEALVTVGSARAILLLSSANIYGPRACGVIDESFPPEPVSDYAVSKLAMEWVARIYVDRLPVIVTRPFNYTGIGQSLSFLIPKIVDHFRRKAPRIELGNLDVARDFSDVRDVASAYVALIDTPAAVGGTYNICSGRAWSVNEIIALAEAATKHRMVVEVDPNFVRTNEVKSLRGSRSKLDDVISARELRGLPDTLRWMLNADG